MGSKLLNIATGGLAGKPFKIGGFTVTDPLGVLPATKKANAEEAQNRLFAEQARQNQLMRESQAALAKDLGTTNTPTVIAGGTADASSITSDLKKKRTGAGGVASSLGLSV